MRECRLENVRKIEKLAEIWRFQCFHTDRPATKCSLTPTSVPFTIKQERLVSKVVEVWAVVVWTHRTCSRSCSAVEVDSSVVEVEVSVKRG